MPPTEKPSIREGRDGGVATLTSPRGCARALPLGISFFFFSFPLQALFALYSFFIFFDCFSKVLSSLSLSLLPPPTSPRHSSLLFPVANHETTRTCLSFWRLTALVELYKGNAKGARDVRGTNCSPRVGRADGALRLSVGLARRLVRPWSTTDDCQSPSAQQSFEMTGNVVKTGAGCRSLPALYVCTYGTSFSFPF